MPQITPAHAQHFTQDWLAAWNAHDLDRILAHYTNDFEMTSPLIPQITGEPSATLRGKPAVRAYWQKALQLIPDLQFKHLATFTGVDSIAIHYLGAKNRPSLEVFHFAPSHPHLVQKAFAHYAT